MEDKIETMSNELYEINSIIAIAKADSEVKEILLSEIVREFGNEEMKEKQEQVFYQDQIYEIIELAKHDMVKMVRLIEAILKTPEIATPIEQHFMEMNR